MRLFSCILSAFALLLFAGTADLNAFVCTGDGQCEVQVDGQDASLGTNIDLETSVVFQSQTQIVSIVDFKASQNGVFNFELGGNTDSRVVVESVDGQNLFPATVTVSIDGPINDRCGNVYNNTGALTLKSQDTVDDWPPPGPVTYEVSADNAYESGASSIIIKAGSTVTMSN